MRTQASRRSFLPPNHALLEVGRVILLLLPVLIVYSSVGQFEYVNFDDPEYIVGNPYVSQGLSPATFHWALTTRHASVWAPITWLSFLTEVSLWGKQPAVSHWINVILHLCNTWLLYRLLNTATGSPWKSFCVAVFFGIHPLHVESVAWVAERKDVLSTFWGLLTLIGYTHYCRRAGTLRYLVTVLLFVLAIGSKPLMVTLPIMMLLLDYWPLRRVGTEKFSALLLEKIPFFAGAMAVALMTAHVQHSAALTQSIISTSAATQFANIWVDYFTYLYKTFVPINLAAFYPRNNVVSIPLLLVSVIALLAVSIYAIINRQNKPHLLVGWLWYLLTLLPMSGVFVFGRNVMADRFTYVPLIGIFIMVVWEVSRLHFLQKHLKTYAAIVVFSLVLGLTLLSAKQSSYWKNDFTLFQRALDVTTDNYLAYTNLGVAYTNLRQPEKAIPLLEQAIRILPDYVDGLNNLGIAYDLNGQAFQAEATLRKAITVNPYFDKAYVNLGSLLIRQTKYEEASGLLQKGLELNPINEKALNNLAALHILTKQYASALELLQRALILSPDNASLHYNLGYVYNLQGDYSRAIVELDIALAKYPDNTNILQLRSQTLAMLAR